jgi:hypothetical protein
MSADINADISTDSSARTESSSQDFDFFFGDWRVRHQRLRERLVGCDDWVEFEGSCSARSVLGGSGNIDDNVLAMPEGTYRAITLRSFDPETRSWSIWWLDQRFPHRLDPPVIGRFEDACGAFYADDCIDDVPIRVRFLWLVSDPQTPRWEQAFSKDGGLTWETNWRMTFVRSPC